MGRARSSETISNKKATKGDSFDMLNNHEVLPGAGEYIGILESIKHEESYLKATAKILSLDRQHDYGVINGFLPINYTEDDVTAEFMYALDNPKKFSEVIGKEVKVYVDITETKDGKEYANMVGYEKL